MKLSTKLLHISLLLIINLIPVMAQTVETRKYQTAYTTKAPEIDGLPNDECWNQVEWSGGFIQTQPAENKPPSQETAFKILYDDNNLYVFIRAYDTEPDKISRIISRRDNFDGDRVEIDIDSYYDKQTAFSFTASASGVKGDEAISEDGNNWDDSWNPIWYLKTSIDDKGWNAEMKIPFSQLRFGKKEAHIWGMQVTRHIFRLEERSLWQFIPKGSPGIVHLFGELEGIQNIKPKKQIELMPYGVARTERFQKEEGNPFITGKTNSLSAGLDGKVAITNDMTLDFTINPDFGQVEADPSEVNLTAFETYLSERRPFFVEGKSIYQFQPNNSIVINNMYSDNLFYSRRIGRYPHYYPDLSNGEYVKMPESTTILGALKLSGKTKKGLSIGIMESLAAKENAEIDNLGTRRKESVEPLTNYYVARMQQDFNKGNTVVGAMFTAVNRDINNPAMDYLHSAAYTGGINFQHNWKERTWYLAGNAEFSNVRGKTEAIINTQTSSARYYQRTDANYLSVDSSLTALSGFGGSLKFGKSSKKRIQFETSVTLRSPGLEFNDIGYMRYSDIIHHGTWVSYYMRDPFSIFNNFYLNTNYWMYWNFGGELLSKHANVNFNSQFKNRWRVNGSFTRTGESLSTNLLRGGPSVIMPAFWDLNLNVSSDQSKKVSAFLGAYLGLGDERSNHVNEFYTGLYIRPINSISVSIEPSYNIQHNKLQYVSQVTANNNPKYIFASLDQKTLGLTFRINYTINPELSIEYYGQPFISAGTYKDYKEITNPHAEAFTGRYQLLPSNAMTYNADDKAFEIDENQDNTTDYSFDKPDYNFRQFRSNLVVRWEYLPGSTLFVVWSQGRTSNDSHGRFAYKDDLIELFGTVPHNVFLIKLSYWFSL